MKPCPVHTVPAGNGGCVVVVVVGVVVSVDGLDVVVGSTVVPTGEIDVVACGAGELELVVAGVGVVVTAAVVVLGALVVDVETVVVVVGALVVVTGDAGDVVLVDGISEPVDVAEVPDVVCVGWIVVFITVVVSWLGL